MSASRAPYGTRSRLLHWISAALVVTVFIFSGGILDQPGQDEQARLQRLVQHNSWGIVLLAVVLVRIWWRTRTEDPLSAYTLPRAQVWAARCVHFALYGLLLAECLIGLGILLAGDGGSFFGRVHIPSLPGAGEDLLGTLGAAHELVADWLLVLIGVHVLAALVHLVFGLRADDPADGAA